MNPIYTGSQISGYKQFFSRENSPLLFKSTLAYSLSEDLKPLLKVNNGFFVEEIGPVIYNMAVAEVQERIQTRVMEIDLEVNEDPFQFWRKYDQMKKR